MADHNTLKGYGIDGSDLSRLDERVGQTLAIHEITRSDSQNYGVGFEVRYSVIANAQTGDVEESGLRAVTFAQPLIRDFLRIVGDSLAPFEFDPALVVELVAEGKTFRMSDI